VTEIGADPRLSAVRAASSKYSSEQVACEVGASCVEIVPGAKVAEKLVKVYGAEVGETAIEGARRNSAAAWMDGFSAGRPVRLELVIGYDGIVWHPPVVEHRPWKLKGAARPDGDNLAPQGSGRLPLDGGARPDIVAAGAFQYACVHPWLAAAVCSSGRVGPAARSERLHEDVTGLEEFALEKIAGAWGLPATGSPAPGSREPTGWLPAPSGASDPGKSRPRIDRDWPQTTGFSRTQPDIPDWNAAPTKPAQKPVFAGQRWCPR
jgi:hypothetical protein